MPGSLRERVSALKSVVLRERATQRVPAADGVRAAISWYGLHRRRAAKAFSVRPHSEELVWVETGSYGICWPKVAPLSRLATALIELRVSANPHFYFRNGTTVRTGDHVIDVGSCEGAFALEALVQYGAGSVWCFEPAPTMARALRHTADGNGLSDRMHIVEAAVGAEAGMLSFSECIENPLASRVSRLVPGSEAAVGHPVAQLTLDEWVATSGIQRIDYIKADVEGSDLDVLHGAAETIRRWRPRIAITTYHDETHCDAMIEFLRSLSLGYSFRVRGVVAFGSSARPVMLHASC